MEKFMDKKEKCYVDEELEAVVIFLDGIVNRIINSTRNVDTQCSVLIGLNTAVMALSLGALSGASHFHLTLFTIIIFSAISALVALCAVRPLRFMVKEGQEESLMYTKKIVSFSSAKKYSQALIKALKNDDELFHQYSMEIYNLSKYYYRPKRKLYSISRNILLLGFLIGLFFLLVETVMRVELAGLLTGL